MSMLEVTATDQRRLATVMSALRRGSYKELESAEVLAFAQAFAWTAELAARMDAALKPQTPVVAEDAQL